MFQFLITNILMVSLGMMIYLFARSLPRLDEEDLAPRKGRFLERWLHSGMPERIDAFLNTYLGKFFRKLKIVLLRLDNHLTNRLKKMNAETNGRAQPKIDFKEITGDNNGAKGKRKD